MKPAGIVALTALGTAAGAVVTGLIVRNRMRKQAAAGIERFAGVSGLLADTAHTATCLHSAARAGWPSGDYDTALGFYLGRIHRRIGPATHARVTAVLGAMSADSNQDGCAAINGAYIGLPPPDASMLRELAAAAGLSTAELLTA